MSEASLPGWDRLRHGGLLLDPPRLQTVAALQPGPLGGYHDQELRRQAAALLAGEGEASAFVAFVLERVCGFAPGTGTWTRGSAIGAEWSRRTPTGDTIKPRHLWHGDHGALLPVFLESERQVGIGRGRRTASQVVQWLRAGRERLALLTNGRQWRLIFAGLDFDAWCEWDVDLWFEEGELSPQVQALRTLLSPQAWTPTASDQPGPLLTAVLDSRKGQAELSAALGERVREAVELLVQSHGDVLREQCADVNSADIYRAAVRVVMRLVVVLFAESRDLLPLDNALYHGAYGVGGLLEELEKTAARGGSRLARSWSAWPRLLALFRLVHQGSHHPALPVPAYGGELFEPAVGGDQATDGLHRALHVFETAAFDTSRGVFPDRDVHRMLEKISRTRVKLRQGRQKTWVTVPVDFSDLSSEYIGILYEGLLDFELKTAPSGDPVIFLAVGNQPALPLSRLEEMDDRALAALLEKMKDTSSGDDEESEAGEETPDEGEGEGPGDGEEGDEDADDTAEEESVDTDDDRHVTRTRAEVWARRAVEAGRLVRRPRASANADTRRAYEESVSRKARQLVVRVVLPGEWYLVRWGGTRKGSGTFYTRPGLAVPTVQRTLRPLLYDPPAKDDGTPDVNASASAWLPKRPEDILAIKTCDSACGSGTFPVAALRYVTDALYAAVHHHGRVADRGDRSVVSLLRARTEDADDVAALGQELIPCPLEDASFEPRLRAVLKRHVVERCIYGVDLDPLAVELCRLSLWIETMDRTLPFSFLDHKVKCGNALVGTWLDQFMHYPVMAWKNREGGDKNHSNGVHFAREAKGKAIRDFATAELKSDLTDFLMGQLALGLKLISEDAANAHSAALALLNRLHDLPIQDSTERARIYRNDLIAEPAYQRLKESMDTWCACWFWPAESLALAPMPTTIHSPSAETSSLVSRITAKYRFFHWELEFPDVFTLTRDGFDAILGNPPWENLQPNPEEFFSNYDPLFRTYKRSSKAKYLKTLFTESAETEQAWIDYNAYFNSMSNWVAYSGRAFGDPDLAATNKDRFTISRGKANAGLHGRWRTLRAQSAGRADKAHPFMYQRGRIFTYRLFLEQCHALLRTGGRMGQIVPNGIYSDAWSEPLRTLFLDHCKWEWLFGFENRERIFRIHPSSKFNPVILEKGGHTASIQTVFMRRRLEDWEQAGEIAITYGREQITRFSPRSKAILEIRSRRALEVLDRIYSNSILLGDQGDDSWGIHFSLEFMMNTDIDYFSPKAVWEQKGYRPDEYSRWIKGNWRPIQELWNELEARIEDSPAIETEAFCGSRQLDQSFDIPDGHKSDIYGYSMKASDIEKTPAKYRCAQPPYDSLPIPRGEIPPGIILSRDASSWIREDEIALDEFTDSRGLPLSVKLGRGKKSIELPVRGKAIAWPLYEGRMIGQFDFSDKGWVSGSGRSAVWRDIPWDRKQIEPQFLMSSKAYEMVNLKEHLDNAQEAFGDEVLESKLAQLATNEGHSETSLTPRLRVAFMDVTSATNERTMISSLAALAPHGNSAAVLSTSGSAELLVGFLNSFVYDYVARARCSGLHLNWFIVDETSIPRIDRIAKSRLLNIVRCLACCSPVYAWAWPELSTSWRSGWALTHCERLRLRISLDVVFAALVGLNATEIGLILLDCDRPVNDLQRGKDLANLWPQGFWRVDRDKHPELRHSVLTLIAFHDLDEKILEHSGDREAGIEAFLTQNNGEGWLLPETVRLADYGLGHDERALEPQPVASRLGPRFYDWQLAQSAEESWRECHLHARNLLGEAGYQNLLAEIEAERTGQKPVASSPPIAESPARDNQQLPLFS